MSNYAPWDTADTETDDEAFVPPTRRRLGLVGTVGLLLTALAGLLMFQATSVLNRTLGTADEDRLADLAYAATREAADAVATPLAREDLAGLRGLVTRLARGIDIAYVLVLDPEGEIVAHSFEGPLPPVLVGANDAPGGQGAQRANLPLPDPVLRFDRPVLDVAMPIVAGQLGIVRVGMNAGFGHDKRRQVLGRMLAIMGATSLVVIALGLVLSRRFLTPAPTAIEATPTLAPSVTETDPEPPQVEQAHVEHEPDPKPETDVTSVPIDEPTAEPDLVIAALAETDIDPAAVPTIIADEAPDADDRQIETEARAQLAEVVALAERIERDGGLPPAEADDAKPALAALSRALTAVSARAEADCRAATEAKAETQASATATVASNKDQKRLTALESQLRHCAKAARAIGRGKWTRPASVADEAPNIHPHIATIERAHEAIVRRVATLVRDLRQHTTDLRDGTERLTGIHGGLQHDLEVQATDTDLAAAKLSNVALGLAGVAKDHSAAASEGRDVLERAKAGRDLLGQMLHRLGTHRQTIAALAPRLNGIVHGTTLLSGHAEALANVAAQVHLLALDAAGRLVDDPNQPDSTGDLATLAQRLRILVVDSTAAADALSVQADQIAREAADSAQSCAAQDAELAQEWEALRAVGDNLQTLASVASSLSKRVAHAAESTDDMPDLDAMTHDVQTIRKAVTRLQDAAKEGTRVGEALRHVAEAVHKGIEPIVVED